VLVGDFGSGKTGLLRWLAAELASKRSKNFPIFLSMAEIRQSPPQNVDDLERLASPRPPNALFAHAIKNYEILTLLDGLDEVMDPSNPDLSEHRTVIDALCKVIPQNSRVLLTCRSMFYEAIVPDVYSFLRDDPIDRTDAAITEVLEGNFRKPEVCRFVM